MSTAVVTGASRGLGRALSEALARRGWSLIVDGRDPALLEQAHGRLWKLIPPGSHVLAIPGDVADPEHRRAPPGAARPPGGLRLRVWHTGVLGPLPARAPAHFPLSSPPEVLQVVPA